VTGQPTPADVALAFTKAWTSHDMAAAAEYVAEDVAFEGPMTQTTGAKSYVEALGGFAQTVTGMRMIAALGDDEGAMIMYEVQTGPAGVLRAAEHFLIRDGQIKSDMLVFDTHKLRQAQSGQAPPG
jgi:SnoaL-like domain